MLRLISFSVITLSLLNLIGCAGAKVKSETVALKAGTVAKSDLFLVKEISADQAVFKGDKSEDASRVGAEKTAIRARLHAAIAEQLKKKGFQAEPHSGKAQGSAIVLEGVVTAFDHGSAAGRAFIGMGAGSSDLVVKMKMVRPKTKETLADFEIVATSGGRGGVFSLGSFLEAHISDAAEKVAEYIAKRVN